jgi:uncharacterized membrane protein
MTEPDRENDAGPVTPQTLVVSNYGLVLTVYILYLVGFLTGITVLVGLIIAYLQRDKTDRVSQSHFQFQITTFWIGLLYFFVGGFDAPHGNRRTNLALVCCLDGN